jgi:hypothetical protein
MPSPSQYESLIAVRNAELATYWTRYNVQVVLNGGLLVAVFASESGKRIAELPIGWVSLGGVALAIIWLVMILLGKDSIHRWDGQLQCFERQLGEGEVYPLFTNIISSGAVLDPWRNMTVIAAAVPVLCAIAWIALWISAV